MLTDAKWDKRLGISTAAADYEHEDSNHSRYEPTAYAVLERLAGSGWIKREDVLVDYGCGKGRVGFYLNYALGCRCIGVEYDEAVFARAQKNLKSYSGRNAGQISFICTSAEIYSVKDANCFYFFNPFSERILRSVLGRILESYYENPRVMRLFFYYALDGYLTCLMTMAELQYIAEIDCRDIFENDDPKERILVFRIA